MLAAQAAQIAAQIAKCIPSKYLQTHVGHEVSIYARVLVHLSFLIISVLFLCPFRSFGRSVPKPKSPRKSNRGTAPPNVKRNLFKGHVLKDRSAPPYRSAAMASNLRTAPETRPWTCGTSAASCWRPPVAGRFVSKKRCSQGVGAIIGVGMVVVVEAGGGQKLLAIGRSSSNWMKPRSPKVSPLSPEKHFTLPSLEGKRKEEAGVAQQVRL